MKRINKNCAERMFSNSSRMKIKKENQPLTIALCVIYILLLIGLIIFKLPFRARLAGTRVVSLIPFKGSFTETGDFMLWEIAYNMFVFIPLGVYLCMLKSKWSFLKKTLFVFSLTTTFEITQFVFAIGRTDITDILSNTMGGIIGIVAYALLFKVFSKRTVKIVNVFALLTTVYIVSWFTHLFALRILL